MAESKMQSSPSTDERGTGCGTFSNEEMAACLRIFLEEQPCADELPEIEEVAGPACCNCENHKPDLTRWHRIAKKVRL